MRFSKFLVEDTFKFEFSVILYWNVKSVNAGFELKVKIWGSGRQTYWSTINQSCAIYRSTWLTFEEAFVYLRWQALSIWGCKELQQRMADSSSHSTLQVFLLFQVNNIILSCLGLASTLGWLKNFNPFSRLVDVFLDVTFQMCSIDYNDYFGGHRCEVIANELLSLTVVSGFDSQ